MFTNTMMNINMSDQNAQNDSGHCVLSLGAGKENGEKVTLMNYDTTERYASKVQKGHPEAQCYRQKF